MGKQKQELKSEVPVLDKATQARLDRLRLRSEKEVAARKQQTEKKRRKFFDAL